MLTNEELDKKILEFKQFAEKEIKKEEEIIIKSKNPKAIYEFAKNVDGANILKLEDAIIATGDAEYIYYFARDVKDANIKKLEDAIMETKNAKYICCFIQVMYGSSIIIDRDVRSIGTVEDTSEIDKLENMNIDHIEFDMILKKYDLKVIGEKVKNSFLNKLYFERKNYTLKYLIKNKELDINEIRLRIYFDYLNNPNSIEEDLEKCNEEYIRYVSMYYGEKDQEEETKENLEKNNEEEKSFVKVKK